VPGYKTMATVGLTYWGRVYVWTIALLGICAIVQSAVTLYSQPIGWSWVVLAVLTLISGSATVKLPSVPATISISETFVFTSVLLFGPAAGTLTVALDALVISLWLARRGHPFYRLAFNICALPASLWIGAHIFYAIWQLQPLSRVLTPVQIEGLLLPLIAFTIIYYLLNSWLIAFAISLEKRLSPFVVWKDNFAWLSLNYFGGASVAALLVTYTRNIDYTYLAFVLPLLVVLYFTFSMSMGRVEDANKHLRELNSLYMSTIETLAMAIDAKDQITHGHIRRVQQLAIGLARALGVRDSGQIKAIEAASLLHDMGKLAVPEYILNKPGSLTPAEFERMKLHASVGADILSAIEFPYPVVPIVRHHHESWDGSGYPDGLAGSQIPIGARILSVVDCFDALTSDRPYRPRLTDADAIKILMNRRGTMYDPLIVDTFIKVHREIAPDPAVVDTARNGVKSFAANRLTKPEGLGAGAGLDNIAASTEETLALYELARTLVGELSLPAVADLVSSQTRRIVPASTCAIYTYDSESDELVCAHAAGENAVHFSGLRIARGQRLTGWVAANQQTILNSDPVLDLGEVARSMRPRLRSCLSTALVSNGELVGVLTLYSQESNAFREDHCRLIEAIARQVSPTLRQAIQSRGGTVPELNDGLAGLPNRQQLRRFVQAEVSMEGTRSPLSVILISLQPSTTSNPPAGELAVKGLGQVADAIRSVLREGDILFRYANDELVLLLTETDDKGALGSVGRIAARLAEKAEGAAGSLSALGQVALGAATAPTDGIDADDLLNAARRRAAGRTVMPSPRPPSIH
jgi:diguanylate cyclase (GGDEF)-like protein/putative nucleotidyltransferase with HDIG domain